ncbi:MAG: hypothetical protein ACTHZI_00095 [Luteimonas sp.]
MNTSPVDDSVPLPAGWTAPRLAADDVVARCRQAHGFQADRDFWREFSRIYTEAETTVEPAQRFAFATEVDGRLARMGLAPWSIMSRQGTAGNPDPRSG